MSWFMTNSSFLPRNSGDSYAYITEKSVQDARGTAAQSTEGLNCAGGFESVMGLSAKSNRTRSGTVRKVEMGRE